ncbi:hypothetical protein ATCC90586_007085 [Pythium insidiosum]|nr:hypothetical protein ATCC90586_007085 [Pythium insidiosum]
MAQVVGLRVRDVAADMDADDARRFLPPPGIHPNNAVFGAVALPKPLTWHRREHMIQRRNILGRIGQLLTRNAALVMGAAAAADDVSVDTKTWALARKLEVLIFLNSASLLEYSNVDSLARRVQALTTSIVNKKIRREIVGQSAASIAANDRRVAPSPLAAMRPAAAINGASSGVMQDSFDRSSAVAQTAEAQPPAADAVVSGAPSTALPCVGYLVPAKRSADDLLQGQALEADETNRFAARRKRHESMETSDAVVESKRRRRSGELGQLLFRGFEEISKIIWSYVDGVQIMRCRAVCRAARVLAPLFVTTLQVSCNGIQRALSTSTVKGGVVLGECVNLRHLDIVSLSSGMTFGKLSMRATNCPQRFVVTHDDHEEIVMALAEQLRCNAFPRLTRLGLTCLFTNEEADGEADVLLNTLMTGCCPQLEELCLPGNSFGDYGAIKISQMLRARVCPKLTRLDLRRNFIAEEGVRSICHALADGCVPDLVELCLGGNTITDSCFHHILFAMESRQLSHLRFLGIEMNYLTSASMEMLGRTIGKMVCPQLSQISYSDNSVDNAVAKRLIATAVYQERMFRLRQQQLRRQQRVNSHGRFQAQLYDHHPPAYSVQVEGELGSAPAHGDLSSDGVRTFGQVLGYPGQDAALDHQRLHTQQFNGRAALPTGLVPRAPNTDGSYSSADDDEEYDEDEDDEETYSSEEEGVV